MTLKFSILIQQTLSHIVSGWAVWLRVSYEVAVNCWLRAQSLKTWLGLEGLLPSSFTGLLSECFSFLPCDPLYRTANYLHGFSQSKRSYLICQQDLTQMVCPQWNISFSPGFQGITPLCYLFFLGLLINPSQSLSILLLFFSASVILKYPGAVLGFILSSVSIQPLDESIQSHGFQSTG